MSKKNARAGGKYGGGHTTVIPVTGEIADIAHQCSSVTKISPGFIKSGLPPTKGLKRVKITETESGLLLSVRGNISHQELRVYADDVALAKACITEGAISAGFVVSLNEN